MTFANRSVRRPEGRRILYDPAGGVPGLPAKAFCGS